MKSQVLRLCVCVGLVGSAGTAIGCKGGRAPGPADDVTVTAPGTVVKAGDHGLVVNAPLGIEVRVGDDGVGVKAPGVNVTTGAAGVAVNAPGVNVTTGANGIAVNAPGVQVKADANGVAVDAPLGVTVRTGNAKQP